MRASRPLVPLLALALVLAACSDDDPPEAGPDPSPAATGSSPAGSPASTASPASSPTSSGAAVALYWLGAVQDPRGPRLYREFVRLPATDDLVRQAVTAMLEREPGDPDHVSLWADGTTVLGVEREGTTAVVDLSRAARTNRGGSGFEAMTVQQLVHTATAADPTVTAVQLLVDGAAVETLWGAVSTREPLRRAPAAEVLGPVWIDAAEGQDVGRRVTGSAAVFEATVSWDVRQDGRVVQEGFSTATEGAPGRGTWTADLTVPAGSYELRAWESSAKDGSVLWLETRQVRVSR